MRIHFGKAALALAFAIAVVGVGLNPAAAQDGTPDLISGGKPPASWIVDPEVYGQFFGPLSLGAPQGTVVVDSGFRPYPNGYPIANWGAAESFINSQLVFGIPDRYTLEEYEKDKIAPPAGLNALSLRRTFGDGVCRDPKTIDPNTGNCELIFGAELLAQMIETGALGGHCFGMATGAAALYNGQLPASQVGASGLGVNITNPMRQPAVQTITRLYGTQYFNDNVQDFFTGDSSPTQAVTTLIRDLQGGTVPYNLIVAGPGGGHAITPFAVLDRGEGIYDIAVYDNNFPMRARAVTVNTNDDTFTYTSSINPSAPGVEWNSSNGSKMGLVAVADVLTEQQCPVCLGENQGTLVTISPLAADNADQISLRLVNEDNEPLDDSLFRILSPLNPPNQKQITQPVLSIKPGVKFGIHVITGELTSKQALEIYAISNGEAQYLLLDELVSNSNSVFGVGGADGALFQSSAASSPRILQLSDQPGVSFDVNGHPLSLPAEATVEQDWNTTTERIRYRSDAKKTLRWNVQIGGLDSTGGREYVGINVKVPAGGTIVVDYSNASATQAPKAWVREANGDRIPVILEPVTKQLINEYRDELYVSRGPE